jgi:hypothetical protein
MGVVIVESGYKIKRRKVIPNTLSEAPIRPVKAD